MKIHKTLIIGLCYIFFSLQTMAQTIVKGQIIDSLSQSPVPFALIGIKSANTSGVSNTEGYFNININNNSIKDTLFISSLGYQTVKFPLSKVIAQHEFKINLSPSVISLPEVTVKPIIITELLNTAIKTSSAKFQSPVLLKGYYREVVKTDSSITKYADGLTRFYLQRDKKNKTDVSTKIEQSRVKEIKLEDEDKYDGLESKIPIVRLAEFIDPMNVSVLDSNNFKYYDYQLGEVNSANMYAVTFKPKANTNLPLYEGTILIDKATDLILGLDYKFSPTMNFKVIKSITLLGIKMSITNRRTIAKYKLEKGNYYPLYIFVKGAVSFESKKFNQTNEFRSELITSNYQSWDGNGPEGLFKKKYLYQNGNSYQSKFWESVNTNPNTVQEIDFLNR